MRDPRTLSYLAVACFAGAALAQNPHLLMDINVQPGTVQSSLPQDLTAVGGWTYFSATVGSVGRQLYRTRSTAGSTQRVAIIEDGAVFSSLSARNPAMTLGTKFLFAATDAHHGTELWASDAATGTTTLLRDITPGLEGEVPTALTEMGGYVYFMKRREMWRTDGTPAGTTLVRAFPGISAEPAEFAVLGSMLVFAADGGGGEGRELWKSDGTAAGTMLLKDLLPGRGPSGPFGFVAAGAHVFFYTDLFAPRSLWSTDGTAAGTMQLVAVPTVNLVGRDQRASLAGELIYTMSPNQLWKSDGTTAGTVLLFDFGGSGGGSSVYGMVNTGSRVFFSAADPIHGPELWITDGTSAGTQRLSDFPPGAGGVGAPMVMSGNLLFCISHDSVRGSTLWTSDGTPSGTRFVIDIDPERFGTPTQSMAAVPGGVLFDVSDGVHGHELWFSDGTAAGSRLVEDLAQGGNASSGPYGFGEVGGTAYFVADDGIHGRELWKSDGTAAGTQMVKDTVPGPGNGAQAGFPFGRVGNIILFGVFDLTHGSEVWRSDGTDQGTYLLKDIEPGSVGSQLGNWRFLTLRGRAYFGAWTSAYGAELWRTDGTAAGTELVVDLNPGPADGYGGSMYLDGDCLYFGGNDGVHGDELVRTDGTAAGTQLLDLVSGAMGSSPLVHAKVGNEFLITASIFPFGRELYRTDGTAAGTVLVREFAPGPGDAYLSGFIELGGEILFASDQILPSVMTIWATDGTNAGTRTVRAFVPRTVFEVAGRFGDRVLFAADELWSTDGTTAGTVLIKEIHPRLGSGIQSSRVAAGTRHAWFLADDGASGRELWRTDGTTAGTVLFDLYPGLETSGARVLGAAAGKLFLGAVDAAAGDELWVLDPGAMARVQGRACGSVTRTPSLTASDPVLGSVMTMRGDRAFPGAIAFVLASFGGVPASTPGVDCEIFINPATTIVLLQTTLPASSWSLPVPIPNLASLAGISLEMQMLMAPTDGVFGFDLSSGLYLTLGR